MTVLALHVPVDSEPTPVDVDPGDNFALARLLDGGFMEPVPFSPGIAMFADEARLRKGLLLNFTMPTGQADGPVFFARIARVANGTREFASLTYDEIGTISRIIIKHFRKANKSGGEAMDEVHAREEKGDDFARTADSIMRVGPKVLAEFSEGSMERNSYLRLCEHVAKLVSAKVEPIDLRTFLQMTPEQRQEKQRADLEMVDSLEREAANLFALLRETGFKVPKE